MSVTSLRPAFASVSSKLLASLRGGLGMTALSWIWVAVLAGSRRFSLGSLTYGGQCVSTLTRRNSGMRHRGVARW